MLPGIILLLAGVIFIVAARAAAGGERRTAQEGIATTGVITGINPVEGGSVRFAIRFTDENGVERTGQSQQFSRTYDRYSVGDSIAIRYTLKTTMGMETVRIRVADDSMKEAGGFILGVLKGMGIVFILLGVFMLIRFFI